LSHQDSTTQVWLPIIGRALAFLCLHSTKKTDQTIAEQALFLENLGLERKDVAAMLGTSPASIAELLRQARNKKGGKRNATKKAKR
jgi:transcriptional regulator